jgi:cation-dependent mannose-6-phosphate receptor
MRLLSSLRALALLGTVSRAVATPEKEEKTSTSTSTSTSTAITATAVATPCVATSASGAFYDLRDDIASAVKDGEKEKTHKGPIEDYLYSKPHDWPYNFTMNVCAPVVKEVKDVVGVDKAMWKNISAYYEAEGKVYSLG